MDKKVARLGDEKEENGKGCDQIRERRVQGVAMGTVCPIGDIPAGNNPVVEAVLEDIPDRHCRGRETMDVKGLVFPLEEMNADEYQRERLVERRRHHVPV